MEFQSLEGLDDELLLDGDDEVSLTALYLLAGGAHAQSLLQGLAQDEVRKTLI